MPCSRDYFPGARQVWIRGGKRRYLIWVKSPRDRAEESRLATELELQGWQKNRRQVCSHNDFPGAKKVWIRSGKHESQLFVTWPRDRVLEAIMAAHSGQVRLRREVISAKKKEAEEEIFGFTGPAASSKRVVKQKLSAPSSQGLATSGTSATALQPPLTNMPPATAYQVFKLKKEMTNETFNFDISTLPRFENEENETKPDISQCSPPQENPSESQHPQSSPSNPPLQTKSKREASPTTASTASAEKQRRRARDSEIADLKEEARLMRAEKKTLWNLVDVLQEQKEMMQGKIKALEWKVARGNKLVQGEQMDALIGKLADTEKELIQKLGVSAGDDRGALFSFGGGANP